MNTYPVVMSMCSNLPLRRPEIFISLRLIYLNCSILISTCSENHPYDGRQG